MVDVDQYIANLLSQLEFGRWKFDFRSYFYGVPLSKRGVSFSDLGTVMIFQTACVTWGIARYDSSSVTTRLSGPVVRKCDVPWSGFESPLYGLLILTQHLFTLSIPQLRHMYQALQSWAKVSVFHSPCQPNDKLCRSSKIPFALN